METKNKVNSYFISVHTLKVEKITLEQFFMHCELHFNSNSKNSKYTDDLLHHLTVKHVIFWSCTFFSNPAYQTSYHLFTLDNGSITDIFTEYVSSGGENYIIFIYIHMLGYAILSKQQNVSWKCNKMIIIINFCYIYCLTDLISYHKAYIFIFKWYTIPLYYHTVTFI